MSSDDRVHLRLAELVRELDTKGQTDVDSMLGDITRAAVEYVPGAHAAGMTVVERGRRVRTVGATSDYASTLDEIQGRHNEGPCLSAAWEDHTVQVDDLASDHRWARFQRDALAETPCRSSVSYQMFSHDNTMGALNLYATEPHAFSSESVESGLVFATHSAVIWGALRRDSQYRSALASRDLIGQAKGMLMERFGIDAVGAFDLLTKLSQESNTKVIEIAQRVVDTGGRGR